MDRAVTEEQLTILREAILMGIGKAGRPTPPILLQAWEILREITNNPA